MSEKTRSQVRVIDSTLNCVELVDSDDRYGLLNETEKVYALLQAASIIATRIDCGEQTWKQFVEKAAGEAIKVVSEINDPDIAH